MAKRSRRARRQEGRKQRQRVVNDVAATPMAPTVDTPVEPEVTPTTVEQVSFESSFGRKTVDFTREYFYVYNEVRNFLLITILMFVVLVGLSFVV